MATVNIGRIKFVWQGAYSGGSSYVPDDIVSYNGSSYVCTASTTGNLPTDTTYWSVMASKGTDGTDITSISGLAQGDILYYNGSAWVRLGAGTNGQMLTTGGAGANPSWTTPATGGAISTDTLQLYGSFTTTNTSYVSLSTPLSITVTPQSTSSKFLILFDCHTYATSTYIEVNLFRNGTALTGSAPNFFRSNLPNWHPSGLHVLDAPNTTSSITYEIKFRSTSGGTVYIGDGASYTTALSVIEI